MKPIRQLIWIAVGLVLFLSLNLVLPFTAPAQQRPRTQTASPFELLLKGDDRYLAGDTAGASKLYRQAKKPFPKESGEQDTVVKLVAEADLAPEAQALWRTAQDGMQQNSQSKVFEGLKPLLRQQPGFAPAYMLYAEAIKKFDTGEELLPFLEQSASKLPDSPELTKVLVKTLQDKKDWLEASITARQFAVVYPDHTEAAEFMRLADENFERFRKRVKRRSITRGILGGIVGVFTRGSADAAIELLPLALQGESDMGTQVASGLRQQLPIVDDATVSEYVSRVGKDIANLMGRKDFNYEFYVVQNKALNAFALPGGKVFVNTGIILAANSEAEFAGLMAHEIAHAVLSHGYEKFTKAALLGNLGEALPFGKIAATLFTLGHSRKSEQQADVVGTRVLASAGYAADGLRNLFVTMAEQNKQAPPEYLSTHPASESRVRYLEELIQRNGYNRYAFEGVKRHADIKERLQQL
jgi:predicted Zn-dependent protease